MFTAAQIAKELDGEVVGDGATPSDRRRRRHHGQGGRPDLRRKRNLLPQSRRKRRRGHSHRRPARAGPQSAHPRRQRARRFCPCIAPVFSGGAAAPGVHPSAVVAGSARVDPSAHVGPHCVIGENVTVGAGAVLRGGNHVGGRQRDWRPNATVPQRGALCANADWAAGAHPRRVGHRVGRVRVCIGRRRSPQSAASRPGHHPGRRGDRGQGDDRPRRAGRDRS